MDSQSLYLHQLITSDSSLKEMEEYASIHNIPIMDKASMEFLKLLTEIHAAERILEVGTAIGYSAINMAMSRPDAQITTLEKNEELIIIGNKNIQALQKDKQIQIISGDAIENMQNLINDKSSFDFIFIDAAKGKYKEFFMLAEQLLEDGGIIVCDNVLFRGYAADPEAAPVKRLKKLAIKINEFNNWVMRQDQFHTSIIPVGDGIAISKKLS